MMTQGTLAEKESQKILEKQRWEGHSALRARETPKLEQASQVCAGMK